ncbi:hypothetical protein ACFWMR_04675 [Amycolatopsis thailandensis]|uniref:hypothetical protein n=1 Tax=Amycolatopsis thailandensis TaxID=589330 RepID=UPI003646E92F
MTAMTTAVARLCPENFYDSSRVEVFIGTGPEAELNGYLGSAWPDRIADPATVAALPVGREFLTATTETDFLTALDNLAEAWTLAGFGLADSGYADELATLDTWWRSNLRVGSSYTFDGGRVLYLPVGRPKTDDAENRWQSITLASGQPSAPDVTLDGRAREAFHRARRQDLDPDPGVHPAYVERATLRRTLVHDVSEVFGVARTAVTVTDDPDREHGGWQWFRVTITDDGTDYRLTCFGGTVDELRVLGPCPECGGDVPLISANDPAALGRYLDARATGTPVPCPPGLTSGVGHTPACPVREDL